MAGVARRGYELGGRAACTGRLARPLRFTLTARLGGRCRNLRLPYPTALAVEIVPSKTSLRRSRRCCEESSNHSVDLGRFLASNSCQQLRLAKCPFDLWIGCGLFSHGPPAGIEFGLRRMIRKVGYHVFLNVCDLLVDSIVDWSTRESAYAGRNLNRLQNRILADNRRLTAGSICPLQFWSIGASMSDAHEDREKDNYADFLVKHSSAISGSRGKVPETSIHPLNHKLKRPPFDADGARRRSQA